MLFSIKRVLFASLGLTGISLFTYLGYHQFRYKDSDLEAAKEKTITIGDRLSRYLLPKGVENLSKWSFRKNKLLKGSPASERFKHLKEKNKSLRPEEVENLCFSIYSEPFETEDSSEYRDVSDYCTYSIRDKVSDLLGISNGTDWKRANDRLKSADASSLSSKLKAVQNKLNENNSDALKNYCSESYEFRFTGGEDELFKSVKSFCTKLNPQKK